MNHRLEKGSIVEGLVALLALSIVIFVILIPKSTRQNYVDKNSSLRGDSYSQNLFGEKVAPSKTAGTGTIKVSVGNAKYTSDPMEEYIYIENRGKTRVDITGWRLENSKSSRRYVVGSGFTQFSSDVGIIPQGAKIISPYGGSSLQNITLEPGDRASVVSGGPGNISPYNVVSFKENLCTGYLEEDYTFPSGHEMSCVRPSNEVGLSGLDKECKNFIDTLRVCHTPKYEGLDRDREKCRGCVDGKEGLSSMCVEYIQKHFSYPSCLANHMSDKNFEGDVWHIYLHRPWEMWADSDETIYLYDSKGGLISTTSY